MSAIDPFIDYYKLLNCSPDASLLTIEQLFRQLIDEYSANAADEEQKKFLSSVVEGFQILRDPQRRIEYDDQYHKQTQKHQADCRTACSTMNDTEERARVLSVLYARRRNNMKHPGLSSSSVAEISRCSENAIEFHLWYFMQKGWVQREESGVLSITALGVDRIDEINLARHPHGAFDV
jgi:curved DNA-binding protein